MESHQGSGEKRYPREERNKYWRSVIEDVVGYLEQKRRENDGMRFDGYVSEEAYVLAARQAGMETRLMMDTRTGVLGKKGWETKLNLALSGLEHQRSFAVAELDLDFFKNVAALKFNKNEDPTGDLREQSDRRADNTIRLFAQMMKRMLEASGLEGYVGRLGGEEFGIILFAHDEEEAANWLEKLRLEVEEKLAEEAGVVNLQPNGKQTVSGGWIWLNEAGIQANKVLTAVDASMMQAKERGRNQVVQGNINEYGEGEELPGQRIGPMEEETIIEDRMERIEALRIIYQKRLEEWSDPEYDQQKRREEMEQLAEELDVLESKAEFDFTGALGKTEEAYLQMNDMLLAEKSVGHETGMILIDIREFSNFNNLQPDKHAAGNRVLTACVELIKQQLEVLGMSGYLIVRWKPGGGFLVMLPHMDEQKLAETAGGIIQSLQEGLTAASKLKKSQEVAVDVVTRMQGEKTDMRQLGRELDFAMWDQKQRRKDNLIDE